MTLPENDDGARPLLQRPAAATAAFEGTEGIAAARDLVRSFLTDLQAVHGLPVSCRVMGIVQFVVSELVTGPAAVTRATLRSPHRPHSGALTVLVCGCLCPTCSLRSRLMPVRRRPAGERVPHRRGYARAV
ncbi:hypothetical protein [Streptomyces flaveolus]|uniref:hypothetical protein n=1 Tax=Streptomyces flaveolus TaxID=67297 RepID=UPI0036FFFAB3